MADADFVKPTEPAPAQKILLSPVDQFMTDTYVCFIMLFPLATGTDTRGIYRILKAGLGLTLSEIPLIGGYLAPEEGSQAERLLINVEEDHGIKFVYRDFLASHDADFEYSYDQLKRDHFPLSALDPDKIQSVPFAVTLPRPATMGLQANFIQGGLFLSTCIHHRVSDALGLAAVLKTWAKHTRTVDAMNGSDLLAANCQFTEISMDRAAMRRGLAGAQINAFPEYRVHNASEALSQGLPEVAPAPPGSSSAPSSPSTPLKLCIFHISATQLSKLKSAASAPNPSDEWISTNDALCAFFWRHITRARTYAVSAANLGPLYLDTPLNFSLALEARRRMDPALPKEYLGNAIFNCPITSDFRTVTSASVHLHTIAKLFREAVTHYDLPKIHGVIGLIDSMAKASDLLMRVHDDPMRGLVVTSWVDTGLYQLDWGGGLGKAESVRMPGVTLPGGTPVCAIFPRMPDGGLEVLMSLELESIEALRRDEEFSRFAEWRGM